MFRRILSKVQLKEDAGSNNTAETTSDTLSCNDKAEAAYTLIYREETKNTLTGIKEFISLSARNSPSLEVSSLTGVYAADNLHGYISNGNSSRYPGDSHSNLWVRNIADALKSVAQNSSSPENTTATNQAKTHLESLVELRESIKQNLGR